MRSPWTVFANLLVALCLVLFQAPLPCRGDAAGQPCSVEACACVAACSCQVTHQKSRDLAAVLTGQPSCCRTDRDVRASAEAAVTAAMSCHTGATPAHFSMPADAGPMLTALTPATLWPPARAARHLPLGGWWPDGHRVGCLRPPWQQA